MGSLYLMAGIHGMTSLITVADVRTNHNHVTAAVGRPFTAAASSISMEKPSASAATSQKTVPWGFSFKHTLRSLWAGGRNRHDAIAVDDAVLLEENKEEGENGIHRENANWVLKILHVRSLSKDKGKGDDAKLGEKGTEEKDVVNAKDQNIQDQNSECSDNGDENDGDDEECDLCTADDGDKGKILFDRDSFSKLLQRVSLAEARLYAQMSYLGNLAYSIPQIKSGNLLRYHGLRFVSSSLEKKEQVVKAEKDKASAEVQGAEVNPAEPVEVKEEKSNGNRISASAAYQIAASAASYLHFHTKSILPFKSSRESDYSPKRVNGSTGNANLMNEEVASLMATTDSVTAVVAANEEVKQAVADDLNSMRSSPCEWFICDDDESGTRFFVIQGSESIASWQANLLFEPIQFEGLDVLVHRGIYEAAKGIYEQMLPEVCAHLKSHGDGATFRFTGHSLGGSLSILVNLMLLIRGEVPLSSLLPVITMGSPSIMCGGDRLLHKLGLPQSHIKAITLHRDIVPRAFSCNYSNHVGEFLKAVNGNFRNHPCLNNQRLLYAPMGELLILQPDEKFSPNHHLLPSGSGLYLLSYPVSDASEAEKQIQAAQTVFLNSPHPLEILSDRSAYGSDGTIRRDHDMNSYLKAIQSVIRKELNRTRKARRERRRRVWWSLVAPPIIVGQGQLNFSGFVQTSKESLKRFSRFVA